MKSDYDPYYRGCVIKTQTGKKNDSRNPKSKSPWIECQVKMPDKTMIYVQSEPTKILAMRSARLAIDDILNSADIAGRWFRMRLV